MKKILKKTLLGLVLVPCMFTVACFGGKDDEPTLEERQNSAYTNLRTLVASEKIVDNTKDSAYTENGHEKMSMYMDYSKSGLKEETVNTIKSQLEMFGMGGTAEEPVVTDYSSSESFGYKTDGTGYREYKQKDSEDGEWYLDEQNITKKVGDKFVDYQYNLNGEYDLDNEEWVETKYAYYVGSDYAQHKYTYNISENDEFDFAGLLELIKNNDSLTKLKSSVSSWAEEALLENLPSAPTEGDEGTSTTSVDLKLENNYSVLEVSISIKNTSINNDGIDVSGDISANVDIKFNKDGLMSVEADMDAKLAGVVMNYETLETMRTDEPVLTNANNVSMSMSMEMNYSVELGTSFNSTLMNSDVTSYIGDGEEGVIQNIEIENDYIFVNTEYAYNTSDNWLDETRYDDVIDMSAEDFGLYNSTISLYWDKDCTQQVAVADKYASYNKPIYVKVTPNTGFAVVNELIVHDDMEDDWFNDSEIFEHEVVNGNYTLSVYGYYFGYDVVKVELNGVEVTGYEDGIELTAGTINKITIHVITSDEK